MKYAVLFVALIVSGAGFANEELDRAEVSSDQIKKSGHLPGTIVVRISESDPEDVAIAVLKEQLKEGEVAENAVFEKVALNSEITGIAFDSGNELDVTTSTSSWRVGVRPGGYYGGGRSYYGGGYRRAYYGGGYRSAYYGSGYRRAYYGSGYRSAYYGGYRRAYYGGSYYRPYYGNGYYRRPYYNNYYSDDYIPSYTGSGFHEQNAYFDRGYYIPNVRYAGYNYGYRPYYSYGGNGYRYYNCRWY
jgi:hypothetical protein